MLNVEKNVARKMNLTSYLGEGVQPARKKSNQIYTI